MPDEKIRTLQVMLHGSNGRLVSGPTVAVAGTIGGSAEWLQIYDAAGVVVFAAPAGSVAYVVDAAAATTGKSK